VLAVVKLLKLTIILKLSYIKIVGYMPKYVQKIKTKALSSYKWQDLFDWCPLLN
jgi:hypothetical protein